MSLSGLAQINIELSSRCDKATLCAFCGHQDAFIHPNLVFGDMDFSLLESLRTQLESGTVIQFHRDGEPTVYPRLREALSLFTGFVTSIVTHGENLVRRADELIGHCTTLTVSVFRGDPDGEVQFATVQEFLRRKGARPPQVVVKIVGDWPDSPWHTLAGIRLIHRLIHVPTGNTRYAHRLPTVPEIGVCLDALHHPSVDYQGRVYLCNRLDPTAAGLVGDLCTQSLADIWTGATRRTMLAAHLNGQRDQANALCAGCTFWGVPSGIASAVRELPMVTG